MIGVETILVRLQEAIARKRAQLAKQLEGDMHEDETHAKRIAIRIYDTVKTEVEVMVEQAKKDEEAV